MKSLTLLLALALPAAAAAQAPAPPADTARYAVLLGGQRVGSQEVWRDADGSVAARYTYKDRQRGPEILPRDMVKRAHEHHDVDRRILEREALRLADAENNTILIDALRREIALYRSRLPYHKERG